MPSLENAQGVYSFWGKRPSWYQLACLVTFLGREEELRKRAVEKLRLKPGDTVLDLACGTGLNFPYLQEAVGEKGKIVGFDYSKEMLNAARGRVENKGWRNVELIQGDAAELSLEYQVDGFLSTLGISAIPRHRKALEKAVGVLRSEGRVAVLDAQPFKGFWGLFNLLIKPVYRYGSNWDYTKDIKRDLEKLLETLEVEEFNGGTMYLATGTKKRAVN